MNENQKKQKLREVYSHISNIKSFVAGQLSKIKELIELIEEHLETPNFYKTESADRSLKAMDEAKVYNMKQRSQDLKTLQKSPYFSKCFMKFEDEKKPITLYFSKFFLPEKNIYSWVSPAATIRFKKPGNFDFSVPGNKTRKGFLYEKDNYLIQNSKVLFMDSESTKYERTLIFQEHFTDVKKDFLLPEIVAKMEESQDNIIRIPHKGSLLISGPAGSGKTTLAFHRIAYLVQSPDTSLLFPNKRILVLVHDNMTKDYFSKLLPELGIRDVKITTFEDWAARRLFIKDYKIKNRVGESEEKKDIYEYKKLKAVNNFDQNEFSLDIKKNYLLLLKKLYEPFFEQKENQLFSKQIQENIYDRFDLIILLKLFLVKYGQFFTSEYDIRSKKKLQYSLILIDEVENYMSEQIRLVKKTLSHETKSMIYVGDLKQQTKLFTLRNWEDIDEKFEEGKKIKLPKVYRQPIEILEFIKKLGYEVQIDKTILKSGGKVVLTEFKNKPEEIEYIKGVLDNNNLQTGIIAKEEDYLAEFKQNFSANEAKIMTVSQAQGVEFERLFIVGTFESNLNSPDYPAKLVEQKKRINKDLLYVALTRASKELHLTKKFPIPQ